MQLIVNFIFLSLVLVRLCSAQTTEVAQIPLSGVEVASVDRLGNFYFVLANGKMQQYDTNGSLLNETENTILPLTLLEPWNPLKVFLYSSKKNEYTYLDHHLEIIEKKKLDPSLSITPQLVCPDIDANKVWILDAADFSLKKVNLKTNQIELDTPIPDEWTGNSQFVFMREYQNRIFLLDKNKGILMLNNLGKEITSINVKGLSFFNFLGQELCYRAGNEMMLLDLLTGETRVLTELTDTGTILFTIVTDERLIIGKNDKVVFYAITP